MKIVCHIYNNHLTLSLFSNKFSISLNKLIHDFLNKFCENINIDKCVSPSSTLQFNLIKFCNIIFSLLHFYLTLCSFGFLCDLYVILCFFSHILSLFCLGQFVNCISGNFIFFSPDTWGTILASLKYNNLSVFF